MRAGGLLGFRRFNVEPARIYMGDTGSMFVGFLLGSLAVINDYTGDHRLGLATPLLILGVPLFDMLFVMYIRWRRGMPVMMGSPDHVALRLRKWRLSTRATARAHVVVSVVFGVPAVGVMFSAQPVALGLLSGLGVILVAVAIWLKTIDMSL